MPQKLISLPDLENLIGQEVGLSRWFTIEQKEINAFADITNDRQFIHIDPVQAAQSPFGGTIAHGFLTLSMLSTMAMDTIPMIEDLAHTVNYGFDRIRFTSPVHEGAQIRGRFDLIALDINKGQATRTLKVTVEIKNSDKPALVAEWLTRHYFS